MKKTKYIRDLNPGDTLEAEPLAIKSVINKVASNGKGFRDFILSDRTGEITGKVWADNLLGCDPATTDDIVLVDAEVEEFRGFKQLNIKRLVNDKTKEFRFDDFIQSSTKDLSTLLHTIEKNIKKVKNKHLKQLLAKFFDDPDFNKIFTNHPAAKMIHHAYLNGLIEHLCEMLNLAEVMTKEFPNINQDVLITGILLHDIGKLDEISYNRVINRTIKGVLIGHVTISALMVHDAIRTLKNFPIELEWHILHLVLSHHGDLQFGSPVVPMTTEALALTQLDQLSSKVNIAYMKTQELQSLGEQFSERIFGLNNNKIFNPQAGIEDNGEFNGNETSSRPPTLF